MTISKKLAFVIIPNLNGVRFLGDSLDSLAGQSLGCQIVVVDNASTDGSQELIQKSYPNVHLIILNHNHGFAGTVNRGIQYALDQNADHIILFNNDAIAEKDWVKNLVTAAEAHPDAGIITGKFMRIDRGHIDSTGDYYSSWGFPFPRGRDEKDTGQYEKPEYIFGGTGGASLYRPELLRQIGLFDEEFFAYYEDVDMSFRAQLRGWKTYYEPKAVAYHHVGGTSSKMGDFARYHSLKNFYYLYAKNMPATLYWKYLPKFLLGAALITGNSLKRLQFMPLIKAYARVVITIPSMAWKRWHIQRRRTVSSDYIDSILYHQIPPIQKGLRRVVDMVSRGRGA
jgi:GT2 family glycosyltransferase